jgi:lipopolysaccharide transport system permease protein
VSSVAISPGENSPDGQLFTPSRVIVPTRGWGRLNLLELWRFRELVYFLTWRDVKVRYKQTVLGAAWAIVQPLLTMVIFTIIFGRVAHLPSDGVPYPIFTFAALLPWTYFAYVIQQAGNSLVLNANMVAKVYFPRLALPLAASLAGLVDLALAFAVFLIMMVVFHIHPTIQALALPLFLVLAIATSTGVGVWLAALSARYRDVKYVVPFLTQVWLYASPVAYSTQLVHGTFAFIYALNPMAGVIQGFRWSLLGTGTPPGVSSLPSVLISFLILATGILYFRRMESTLADVI